MVISSRAFPFPMDEQETLEEEIEAKEIKYEELREHDLQESVNGGQSGWALSLISQGQPALEVVWGSRPKRQAEDGEEPMMDHLQAPSEKLAPIDPEYAKRLEGSAIYKALQLAGAGRQEVSRGPGGYGRRRRQTEDKQTEEESAEATVDAPAPIDPEYAKRLEGSAIYKALKIAGAARQEVSRGPGGYGRKRRQTLTPEDEAVLQQIFEVQDHINTIEQASLPLIPLTPKIKSWGETGHNVPQIV